MDPRRMWRLFPERAGRAVYLRLVEEYRRLKAPRMIWGYRDSDGSWRPRTRINDTTHIDHPASVAIADNVFVGPFCILDGTGGLKVGEGCQLAGWNGLYTHSSHVAIRAYGDHYQEVPEYEKMGFKVAPVTLGRYVFVGAGAKILPGVEVGDGALVAANSVVTRDVEAFAIVRGSPEVVGDTRQMDQKYLEDPLLARYYAEWAEN